MQHKTLKNHALRKNAPNKYRKKYLRALKPKKEEKFLTVQEASSIAGKSEHSIRYAMQSKTQRLQAWKFAGVRHLLIHPDNLREWMEDPRTPEQKRQLAQRWYAPCFRLRQRVTIKNRVERRKYKPRSGRIYGIKYDIRFSAYRYFVTTLGERWEQELTCFGRFRPIAAQKIPRKKRLT